MADRLPGWIRVLLAADRAVVMAARIGEVLRDELLFAWVTSDARSEATAMLYASQVTYLPGGPRFNAGLFDWERKALATPPFPSHGRVLLGGAGGGRELAGLCASNYEVVAFEPSPTLAAGAQQVAVKLQGAEIYQASYADLIRAVRHGKGPLAGAPLARRFDAVVFGWGSFSHLTDPDERMVLLHAVRDLAPTAPILLSWLPPPPPSGVGVIKVQRVLRWLFSALGATGVRELGDGFISGAGFYTGFVGLQVESMAADAGYRVVLDQRWPYPHALLVPGESPLA